MTDPRFLSRRNDPHTSHAAAAAVAPSLGRIQAIMLEAFRNAPNGLTPDEAEIAAGLHIGSRRRVSELHNAGLIEPNGDTRLGRAGKAQRVFVAVHVSTDLFGGIS